MYVGGKLLANKTPAKTTCRGLNPNLKTYSFGAKNECFAIMLVDTFYLPETVTGPIWVGTIVIHWLNCASKCSHHDVTKIQGRRRV